MSDDHTRGPWIASESDTRPGLWAVWADAGMAGIAQVAIIPNELAHAKGNAQLIAKAPELLEENERLREAHKAAVEIAETIYHNPAGSLWNYGTTPTAKDRAEWKGARDAALEILQYLDPERARAALGEGGGE